MTTPSPSSPPSHLELLKALTSVKTQMGDSSICQQVRAYLYDPSKPIEFRSIQSNLAVKQMEELWVRWPEYSGNLVYPVPSPTPQNPTPKPYAAKDAYMQLHHWIGEYGESRKRLLTWLIHEVSKIVLLETQNAHV
jgi:hypothetical protein